MITVVLTVITQEAEEKQQIHLLDKEKIHSKALN